MADTKITQLGTATSLASADLFVIADDPAGTPVSRSVRMDTIRADVVADSTSLAAIRSDVETNANVPNYWPQTAEETAASVTPSDYSYAPGNVLRYGATGDGSTDDTTAFQNAINVAELKAGEVYVPNGTYSIDALTIDNTCALIGELGNRDPANECVVLKQRSANPMITLTAASADLIGCRLQDLQFKANGFSGPAIKITGTNENDYHVFRRIFIRGTTASSGGDGFNRSVTVDGRMIWCRWEDISIEHDTDTAFYVETSSAVNLNTFSNVRLAASQHHGLYINRSGGGYHKSNNFYGCNFENNGADISALKSSGAYLSNVSDTGFFGGYFELNGAFYGQATDASASCVTTAGTFGGVSLYNCHLVGSDYCVNAESSLWYGEVKGCLLEADVRYFRCTSTDNNSGINITCNYETGSPSGGYGIDYGVNVNGDARLFNAELLMSPIQAENAAITSAHRKSILRYVNTSAVTLTNSSFADALPGQLIVIINDGSSTITLTHSANLVLSGSRDAVLENEDKIVIVKLNDTKFEEVLRNFPSKPNAATTTELEDVTGGINTQNKAEGAFVFNTTTNKPVYASGSTAGSVWVDATGATAHTPV